MKPMQITLTIFLSLLGFVVIYFMLIREGYVITMFSIMSAAIILDFINTNFLRHKGKYPPKGQVTINDVVRFVSEGKTILALRAYRELHNCGIIHAEKAIQEIRKEMQDQKLNEQGE